jgi:hypothetical protein
MTSDRILDLRPVFGVLAQVISRSADTGGKYVELECTADPGRGTMVHYTRIRDSGLGFGIGDEG